MELLRSRKAFISVMRNALKRLGCDAEDGLIVGSH